MTSFNNYWTCECGNKNSIKDKACTKCHLEIPRYIIDNIYSETLDYYKTKYQQVLVQRQKRTSQKLRIISWVIIFITLTNIIFFGYFGIYKNQEIIHDNFEYNQEFLAMHAVDRITAIKDKLNETDNRAIQYKIGVILNYKIGFAKDSFTDAVSNIHLDEKKIYSISYKIKEALSYVKQYIK